MTDRILQLQDFSVQMGSRLILKDINLDIARGQVLVIMGPGGAGKSTLLRTLCGLNDTHPALYLGGSARYLGQSIHDSSRRPMLVEQNPRMMIATVFDYLATDYPRRSEYTRSELKNRLGAELKALGQGGFSLQFEQEILSLTNVERRLLMLTKSVLTDPPLLCVDEPTMGFEESEARQILDFLSTQRRQRAILMVTHNQRHGREISDHTALLAGGTIHEYLPTEEFYFNPQTDAARSFIRTGSCTVPSINARPEELEPSYRPPISQKTPVSPASESRGPYGFRWMRPGQLAGTPMPGVVRPVEEDLKALSRVNITLLVTLTMEPFDAELLASVGINACHFPIIDMQAPTLEATADFCRFLDHRLEQGDIIALHCLAGIGRTGTMLATFEIWKGSTAEQAFAAARQIHPRWVQSQAQYDFLTRFEHFARIPPSHPATYSQPELDNFHARFTLMHEPKE